MFELTTCVVVDSNGQDCMAPRADWSPLPICLMHLREAYLIYAEHLQYLPSPTAQDQADVEKMAVIPSDSDGDVEPLVYYVRIGHHVKIGTTRDLYNRMASLQPDEILALEVGGSSLERERHRQFDHIRATKGREYFLPTVELMDHIAEVRGRWVEPEDRPSQKGPTAGHQKGVICPSCDMKAVYLRQINGPTECRYCGYRLPDSGVSA